MELLLTIAETAALLHVSADTITREIRRGIIPTKRLRCTVRISRAWIDSYVAESAPMLLTRRQVSQKLNVSVESVRTLQRKGLLPTVMIAGRQRIPAAAVAEYVRRNSFAFLRSRRGSDVQKPSARPPRAVCPAPSCHTRFSSVLGV